MKYIIRRTSIWDDEVQPCEGAVQELVPHWDCRWFKTPEEHDKWLPGTPWLSVGRDHGSNEHGIYRRLTDQTVWVIEAPSIEAVYERYGTLVVSEPRFMVPHWERAPMLELEIYDSYRE